MENQFSQDSILNEQHSAFDLSDELIKNTTVHKSLRQEIIITTSDKIRVALTIANKKALTKVEWHIPFGLTVTLLTTLCTADFRDTLGASKEFWHTIFIIGSIGSFIWLVVAIIKALRLNKTREYHKIIEQLKMDEVS